MREKVFKNEISEKFPRNSIISEKYTFNWNVLAEKQIQMISLVNLTVDMINEGLSYDEVMMI